MYLHKCGSNHGLWKGGRIASNKRRKEKRHLEGINKAYRSPYDYSSDYSSQVSKREKHTIYMRKWRKSDLQRAKIQRKRWKYNLKKAGKLTIKTIQQVYEDNIKKYGTLICYLCLEPIVFGKDHLEHKIPLSRGGTNARDNLDIACQKCNCSKHNKTEEEYKKIKGGVHGNRKRT